MSVSSRLFAGAAAIALLVPAAAAAQEASEVEGLVITAARTDVPRSALPSTVQVIGEREVAQQTALGASAVETVAALVPSFSPTRQKLSGFGESLRGRSPLFLVDGVPQSTPLRDDSRDGFTIDPFFIDRVEVIFGASAIQGIGATGGVVNYVTAAPAQGEAWSGRVLGQVGLDDGVAGDSLGWKAAGRAGRDFGDFDVMVGAAYETRGAFYDAEGRRIGLDGAQGELQDSDSASVFLKSGYDFTPSRRIELMVNHFRLEGDGDYVTVAGDRDAGLPTSAERGEPDGEIPYNHVTSAALTFADDDLAGGRLRAQAYVHHYEGVFGGGAFGVFQDPDIAPVGTLFDQSANNSEKQGLKVDYERTFAALPGFRALAGVDLLRDKTYQALILTDRLWVPETVFRSVAPFVQLHQGLWDERVHLSGGLRWENATLEVDDFTTLAAYGSQEVDGGSPEFSETLVNVGATFEVVEGATAYASFAQGFTMADVGRVLRGIDQPGQDVDTFLDVTPVVSDNIEAGVEYRRGPVRASAAWFQSSSDRGSRLVLVGGVYEVQREATEIEGVELTGRWDLSEAIAVGGAYAHLEGRTDTDGDGGVDTDLDGSNIGPDRLLAYVEGEHGPWSARLQGQLFMEREFDGGDPRNDFEGHALADLLVQWRGEPATVSVGVQNLFDEQYITYFSDVAGPTDDLRYFAGRGRSLTVSVRKDF